MLPRLERSANATTVRFTKRTQLTVWPRIRCAGWKHELYREADGSLWWYSLSWGKPRKHSRLAFHAMFMHRGRVRHPVRIAAGLFMMIMFLQMFLAVDAVAPGLTWR